MKTRLFVLSVVLLMLAIPATGRASSEIPDKDQELFMRLYRIMQLPKGTHKIYNGQGNTTFDVLYTIQVGENRRIVYKGGTKSVFDILYSIERSGKVYRIHQGDPDSVFNILYTIKLTGKGFEIYKGDSNFNLIYTYERD